MKDNEYGVDDGPTEGNDDCTTVLGATLGIKIDRNVDGMLEGEVDGTTEGIMMG